MRRRTEAENEDAAQAAGRDDAPLVKTEAIIQRRLQAASREIENYSQYDYILVNDGWSRRLTSCKSIVKAERLKRSGARADAEDERALATAERA